MAKTIKEGALFKNDKNHKAAPKQPTDNRPGIQITLPDYDSYKAWQRDLDDTLNLSQLETLCAPFIKLIRKYRMYVEYKGGNQEEPEIFQTFLNAKKFTRSQYLALAAYFLEPHNFLIYFNTLSPMLQDMWRAVIRQQGITIKEAERIAGMQVLNKKDRYASYCKPASALEGWFRVFKPLNLDGHYYYMEPHIMLGMNRRITYHLIPALFPKEWEKIDGLENLPKDKDLLTFCGEEHIFTEIPAVIAMNEGKALQKNKNGSVSVTSIRAAAKQLNIPEFLPKDLDAKTAMMRSLMVVNTVGTFAPSSSGKKQLQDEQILKQIVNDATVEDDFILPAILSDLTGMRSKMYYDSDITNVTSAIYLEICLSDNKQWRSFDTLFLQILKNYPNINYFLLDPYYNDGLISLTNKYSAKDVTSSDFLEQVTLPLMRGYIFFLAAFGLVEIAYRRPMAGDASPYNGLQYVRVTDLGRYCAERIKEYTPKTNAVKQFFEADEENLIVKSLEGNNPMLPILTDIAEPITQRLYKVSYASFLRNCSNAGDIDTRVKQFKKYICPKPSAVWKNFFADVRRRFKPFEATDTKYTLAKIPADNKELQHILLTDPIIRKYTVKAEGYLLLIETANHKKVADRLKTYGYLI